MCVRSSGSLAYPDIFCRKRMCAVMRDLTVHGVKTHTHTHTCIVKSVKLTTLDKATGTCPRGPLQPGPRDVITSQMTLDKETTCTKGPYSEGHVSGRFRQVSLCLYLFVCLFTDSPEVNGYLSWESRQTNKIMKILLCISFEFVTTAVAITLSRETYWQKKTLPLFPLGFFIFRKNRTFHPAMKRQHCLCP